MMPSRIALAILSVAAATIGGAWVFQAMGYAPCELCLAQRWLYYAGLPLAAVVTIAAVLRAPLGVIRAGFALLAIVFAGSAIFGAYHAGVEWGFWPGPSACSGGMARPASMQDFRHQLETIHLVRCDAAALRIVGLSLAGWNAVVSAALAYLALVGFRLRAEAAPQQRARQNG